jgi:hypothetical protein
LSRSAEAAPPGVWNAPETVPDLGLSVPSKRSFHNRGRPLESENECLAETGSHHPAGARIRVRRRYKTRLEHDLRRSRSFLSPSRKQFYASEEGFFIARSRLLLEATAIFPVRSFASRGAVSDRRGPCSRYMVLPDATPWTRRPEAIRSSRCSPVSVRSSSLSKARVRLLLEPTEAKWSR